MGSRTGTTDDRDHGDVLPAKGVIREYIEVILFCVIFILFARHFVFQQSEIPSGSMEDTILIGDYILVNRFSYAESMFEWERRLLRLREIERGDVIVFKHPPEPERDFIKRVAGTPGDVVELRAGRLWVNQRLVDEPYVNDLYRTAGSFGPFRVPPGHYFVLGDHRNHSRDSRAWGTVPRALVKGRAFLILLSASPPDQTAEPQEQVSVRSVVRKLFYLVLNGRWDRALRPIH